MVMDKIGEFAVASELQRPARRRLPADKRMTTPWDAQVGVRVKALRVSREMSRSDLGKACGVSFQQMQKYESGVNRLSGGRLALVAEALGVTVGELLEEAPRVPPGTSGDESESSYRDDADHIVAGSRDGARLLRAARVIGAHGADGVRALADVAEMLARALAEGGK
jgi:transcriptional regulator with XRE-family HTH domain